MKAMIFCPSQDWITLVTPIILLENILTVHYSSNITVPSPQFCRIHSLSMLSTLLIRRERIPFQPKTCIKKVQALILSSQGELI
jgi:hypothetical protein